MEFNIDKIVEAISTIADSMDVNAIADGMQKYPIPDFDFDSVSVLNSVVENFPKAMNTASLVADAFEKFAEEQLQLRQRLITEQYMKALDSVLNSIEQAEPLLDENAQKKCEEIKPVLTAPKHHLTLSEVIALIGLLFTILSYISQTATDRQLETIIQQNQTQIELLEEKNEAEERENRELLDIVENLTESIQELNEIAEQMSESSEQTTAASTEP